MNAVIVGGPGPLASQVRQVLLREGVNCPDSQVVAAGKNAEAAALLAQGTIDLLILIMSATGEGGLELLADLRPPASPRVLAVGPAGDSKLVLRILRSGAHDFIDQEEIDTELASSLARLQAERAVEGRSKMGRTIALLAPSGGSGSSTLAANVAAMLAKEHGSAALIDMKLQSGDLSALLDLRPSFTLADVCQNVDRLDRMMFETSLVRHASGVHLLAPPKSLGDVEAINPDGVRRALALARSAFPFVLVDLDHSFQPEQVEALQAADLILLVIRLEFASLRNARRTIDHLEFLGISRQRVRLVVNRYGQPKEVPAAKAEEALGMKVFHYVPDEPKTVMRANNTGVPIVIDAPSSKVAKSLSKLAFSVNGGLKDLTNPGEGSS